MAMVNTPGPRPPNQVLISTTKNGMAAPLLPISGTRSSAAVDSTMAATAIPYRRDQWFALTITESPRRLWSFQSGSYARFGASQRSTSLIGMPLRAA